MACAPLAVDEVAGAAPVTSEETSESTAVWVPSMSETVGRAVPSALGEYKGKTAIRGKSGRAGGKNATRIYSWLLVYAGQVC